MVAMVTKQKIFDQLYLLSDIQGWTYTSQKFHVPRSRYPWYPLWFQNPWYPKGYKEFQVQALKF